MDMSNKTQSGARIHHIQANTSDVGLAILSSIEIHDKMPKSLIIHNALLEYGKTHECVQETVKRRIFVQETGQKLDNIIRYTSKTGDFAANKSKIVELCLYLSENKYDFETKDRIFKDLNRVIYEVHAQYPTEHAGIVKVCKKMMKKTDFDRYFKL